MPSYETVFVVPSTLAEEERSRSVKEIEKMISKSGGKVTSSEDLGEKRLAYKIKNHDRAYYHLIKFDSSPDFVEGLKRHFKIEERFIRSMVVREED